MERTATHGWVAKFFYEIFAVGANRADEVGEVKAILIAQCGCYQSQELRVGYGHESLGPPIQNSNINLGAQILSNYITKWLFNPPFDLS